MRQDGGRGTEGEHGKLELKPRWWNHRRQPGVAPAQRQVAGFLYRLIMRNGEIRGAAMTGLERNLGTIC